MKLILAGGGGPKDSELLDKKLIDSMPDKSKMLYIPIAMWQDHTYSECYDFIRHTFQKFNFTDIEMWTDLNNKTYEDIKDFGCVYIGGGNTFKLLYELRKTNFIEPLIKYIKNNGIVYGGSAGAIIFGSTIEFAQDNNFIKLTDFKGLNLLNEHMIWCHYNKSDDKKLFDLSKKNKIPILAIPEKSGIFIDNENVSVIGTENVYLFQNNNTKTDYKHGENIRTQNLYKTVYYSNGGKKVDA